MNFGIASGNHTLFSGGSMPGRSAELKGPLLGLRLEDFGLSPNLVASLAFGIRVSIASIMAFWIACKLQLDSPQWAMLTVWIVARPEPGLILSRAAYRLLGTVLGCVFGLMLVALFAQHPTLFVAALALLLGVCTLVAHLLTNLRSYAAVLAGYTAAIVSLGAFNNPDNAFMISVTRGSCVVVGIFCTIFTAGIFAPRTAKVRLLSGLRQATEKMAIRLALPWNEDNDKRLRIGKDLLDRVIALKPLLEMATGESRDIRVHKATIDRLLVNIFGAISAKRNLDAALLQFDGWVENSQLQALWREGSDFLKHLPQSIETDSTSTLLEKTTLYRSHLEKANPESASFSNHDLIATRAITDRLSDLLQAVEEVFSDWQTLDAVPGCGPRVAVNFHRDHRSAWLHAIRATISIGSLGAFWIASAWPHGPGALIITSVLTTLISTFPFPDRVSWKFLQASVFGVIAAYFFKFWILNHATNFETLAAALFLFMGPIGVMYCYPSLVGFASAVPMVFLTVVAPSNEMTYSLPDFLNLSLATLIGVLFGASAYRIIFPTDVRAGWRYIVHRCRRSLEELSQKSSRQTFPRWSTRMYDRITRLGSYPLASNLPEQWLSTGLGAIDIGAELFRIWKLHDNLSLNSSLRVALHRACKGFEQFSSQPEAAIAAVQAAKKEVYFSKVPIEREARIVWARAAAALEIMDAELSRSWSIATRTATLHAS